jgi:hypothetical protein
MHQVICSSEQCCLMSRSLAITCEKLELWGRRLVTVCGEAIDSRIWHRHGSGHKMSQNRYCKRLLITLQSLIHSKESISSVGSSAKEFSAKARRAVMRSVKPASHSREPRHSSRRRGVQARAPAPRLASLRDCEKVQIHRENHREPSSYDTQRDTWHFNVWIQIS